MTSANMNLNLSRRRTPDYLGKCSLWRAIILLLALLIIFEVVLNGLAFHSIKKHAAIDCGSQAPPNSMPRNTVSEPVSNDGGGKQRYNLQKSTDVPSNMTFIAVHE